VGRAGGGLNELQSQYEQQYGPGSYVPNVFIQYWAMRVMAYAACVVLAVAAWGGWLIHRRKLRSARWFLWAATWIALAPFLMNIAGWLLTESGRQPWIVQGLMTTTNGVSPSVSSTAIWISLLLFIALYGILAIVEGILMFRYARRDLSAEEAPAPTTGPDGDGGDHELVAALTY
jgi:cytochrome bd-type quinol oxidase subunit 1